MTDQLKPCPFCGSNAEWSSNDFYNDNSMARCVSCGASAFWRKWNAIATPTPLADAAAIAERETGALTFDQWWGGIANVFTLGSYDENVVLAAKILTENAARRAWETALSARAALATTEATDAIAPTEGVWHDAYEAENKRVLRLEAILVRELGLEKARNAITAPSPEAPAVDALTTGAVSAPPLGENKVAYLPKDIQDWGRFRTVATPYFCRPVSLVENWPVPLSMDQGHVLEHSVELRFEDEEDADLFFSMYSDAMGSAAARPASEPKALTKGADE